MGSIIGDPTAWGWTITFAYFAAAVLCFRAGQRSPNRRRWWRCIAGVELLLGINKELDLHQYVTVIGRAIVNREGASAHARQFQAVFISILLCLAVAGLIIALKGMWPVRGRYAVAFAGLFITIAFVVVRAASFNHVGDRSPLIDPVAKMLEPLGIMLISVSALITSDRISSSLSERSMGHRMFTCSVILLASVIALRAEATPPTTRPTSLPSDSLFFELTRAVEIAQKSLRTPKPATKPAKNSYQRGKAAANEVKSDPCAAQAAQLEDKSGLIAFRVSDVYGHESWVITAPPAVQARRGAFELLVTADCDNPTPIYFTDDQRRELQSYHDKKWTQAYEGNRAVIEDRKPKSHHLWILTSDPKVRDWAQGSRHTVRARVVSASFLPKLNGYVEATLVLVMEDEQPAPTSQPAK